MRGQPGQRRKRDRASRLIALLVLVVPLVFQVVVALADDGREPEDLESGAHLFPAGELDADLHQVAARGRNSWRLTLDEVSRDLAFGPMEPHDPAKRGAGDISFVAKDVDGLDGLGALGDNDHAPGEYVDLDALPVLIKRTALLVHRLP